MCVIKCLWYKKVGTSGKVNWNRSVMTETDNRKKKEKKKGKDLFLFNDALNTFLFTVIWRRTYGKEPFR